MDTLRHGKDCQDDCYKSELPQFYAYIESKQRQRNLALRQAEIGQRAGEPEAMQQTKRESDHPGQGRRAVALSSPRRIRKIS